MAFVESGGLKYYRFESFPLDELIHGIFTRLGGVSPEPWASLNLGGTVGDLRDHVIENRRRMFDAIQRPVESGFDVWQVHGVNVIATDRPRPLDASHEKADAILTSSPEITLYMRFADCVPILLYDPVKRVVGMVHAGWQGTVEQICRYTVEKMQSVYGSRPGDLLAGIGPSIGPDHYEVGPDVVARVRSSFNGDAKQLLCSREGRVYFDLWAANRLTLEKAGVKNIETAGLCTACDTTHWFSHRAEKGKTGRFGAAIALKTK